MESIDKININNILDLSNLEKEVLMYLINRNENEILLANNYEKTKLDLANDEIKKLQSKKDLFVTRIKNGRIEEKINSLEERFNIQKNYILNQAEKRLYFYADNLKTILEIVNLGRANLEIEFEVQNLEKKIVFPINIFSNNGDIYIKNINKDNVYLYSLDEKTKLNELELKKYFSQITNGNCKYYLCKRNNKKNIEMILEKKGLKKRLLAHKVEIYNKSIFNGVYDYKKIIEKDKKDVIILEEDKNDREILIRQILIDEILKGSKIAVLKNEQIANVVFTTKSEELKKEITKIEKEIERYKFNRYMFDKKITETMSLFQILENTKKYEYSNEKYIIYKKNLNLSSLNYDELLKVLENISSDDVLKYKSYKNLKQNIEYFNQYSFMDEYELENLFSIIENIKSESEYLHKNYKNYYKKIIFRIKQNKKLLDSKEISNLAKIIYLEKNGGNKLDKRGNSIFEIFFQRPKKNAQPIDTSEQEMKILMKVYSRIEDYFNNLYNLNSSLFFKIISVLTKDSFDDDIEILINNIQIARHNKNLLSKINGWNSTKNAIVEYIALFNEFEEVCEDIKAFKLLDLIYDFSEKNNVDLNVEYQAFIEFNTKIVERRELLKKDLLNESVKFVDCNKQGEIKSCDLLIIEGESILDDEKMIEFISASNRFISFRGDKMSELEEIIAN